MINCMTGGESSLSLDLNAFNVSFVNHTALSGDGTLPGNPQSQTDSRKSIYEELGPKPAVSNQWTPNVQQLFRCSSASSVILSMLPRVSQTAKCKFVSTINHARLNFASEMARQSKWWWDANRQRHASKKRKITSGQTGPTLSAGQKRLKVLLSVEHVVTIRTVPHKWISIRSVHGCKLKIICNKNRMYKLCKSKK